jgi:hypothetical protein
MQERVRTPREALGAGPDGAGLGSIFSDAAGDGSLITVEYGLYREQLPGGGMTVRQIRARYADRFDIDPDSVAILNGRAVDENTMVSEGQELQFSKHIGEKG